MVKPNFGPKVDLAKTLAKVKTTTTQLSTRDVLQNASIGAGGLLVEGGGSITIQSPGTLNLGGGVLSVSASFTAGTTITAGGNIETTGGNLLVDNGAVIVPNNTLISTYARNHQVVTGYVSAWLDSSGNLLATASSERFKRDIEDYGGGGWRALRSIRYRLRAAWILADMRGDDLDTVPWEIGVLAEEALAAGYPELVVLDAKGKPWSFHYERLAVVAISAAQELDEELAALRAENGEFRKRLDALDGGSVADGHTVDG